MLRILLFLGVATVAAADKPNVIVILADDLGASDLGCYGNTFHETPHLDQLAKDGVKFTRAYSACTVCSPTRAALLTGQYPARLHITDWIAGHERPNAKLKVPDWTKELDPNTFTLADAFKASGYATTSIGKWHLGDKSPTEYGFDVNIAGTNKGQPPSYFSPYRIPTLKDGPDGECLNDRLASEACNWIAANKEKPFFLYLPTFAVHTPLMGKKDKIEKYKAKAAKLNVKKNETYAALVESLDDTIGTLRAKLKELKLDEKTIIIFTSDNGGLIGNEKNPITSNPPFRAGKGSAYEGGVRVPMILKSPYQPSHEDECLPSMTIDIMPSVIESLNLMIPLHQTRDGKVINHRLKEDRALYWHYPHYHPGGATPYSAMMKGDWRLIEFFENGRVELYNLKDDVGEKNDLSKKQPAKVKELHNELKAWREKVGAQMPTPNPDYKPNPQAKDGSILLHSREANVVGMKLQYEPQPHKDTLGFWTEVGDYATWEFTVTKPGTFSVEVLQGCGKGAGGSEAFVKFGNKELNFIVEDTGGFQEFKARNIGSIVIEKPGKYTLELRAKTKAKNAVMDCRQITLTIK